MCDEQEILVSPKEALAQKLEELRSPTSEENIPKYIYVPPVDESIIEELSDGEAQVALMLLDAAPAISEFYDRALTSYQEYSSWREFCNNNAYPIEEAAEAFRKATVYAAQNPEANYLANYLAAIAFDISNYIPRDNANGRAEEARVLLPNTGKLNIICNIGLERYHPLSRYGARDASFNMKVGEQKESTPKMRFVRESILAALQNGNPNQESGVAIRYGEYHFIFGSGLHGKEKDAPPASQYVYEIKTERGKLKVLSVYANLNIQKIRTEELLLKIQDKYSPQYYEHLRVLFGDISVDNYGHEVAEAELESRNPKAEDMIGREGIEIASTLVALVAMRENKSDPSFDGEAMYRESAQRFLAKMVNRGGPISDPTSKLAVYVRGYNLVLERLDTTGAILRDADNKISGINWPVFDKVIDETTRQVLSIIQTLDKSRNDHLFGLSDRK